MSDAAAVEVLNAIEEFRAALAQRGESPDLKHIAGGFTLVLVEAWPHLSDQWRNVFVACVVLLERRGGGNAALEAAEKLEADSLHEWRALLDKITRRDGT